MKKYLRTLRRQLVWVVNNLQNDFDEMTDDQYNEEFLLHEGTAHVKLLAEELIDEIDVVLDNS